MSEIKTFTFHKKRLPEPPDTPKRRAEKDLLIKEWLKHNKIKKFLYRGPQ